jgi:hypothetical protein
MLPLNNFKLGPRGLHVPPHALIGQIIQNTMPQEQKEIRTF